MKIQVKLFATLRQQAGWSEQELEVADDATVEAALATLAAANPALDLADRAVYAAVNRQYANLSDPLHEGDTVAIFPPVSGGRQAEEGTHG